MAGVVLEHLVEGVSFLDLRIVSCQFFVVDFKCQVLVANAELRELFAFQRHYFVVNFRTIDEIGEISQRIADGSELPINNVCLSRLFVIHKVASVKIVVNEGEVLRQKLLNVVVPVEFFALSEKHC